ncbi:hypothetical protein [Aestuariibius sp. HNIBRBA575]|uniref:hypothetical protein n=1 Tax=Aestuariibius sp. HNIBRBA575 TaxID=3233343 RepID=UPI0034A3553D
MVAAIGFVFGRIFSQAEAVLAEKRRIYEEFLMDAPAPNDAYYEIDADELHRKTLALNKVHSKLMLYASHRVLFAASQYLSKYQEAQDELTIDSGSLHPRFKAAAKAQNDLILEMRRDALGWSTFGYYGKSRLPEDALEQAKRNSL